MLVNHTLRYDEWTELGFLAIGVWFELYANGMGTHFLCLTPPVIPQS